MMFRKGYRPSHSLPLSFQAPEKKCGALDTEELGKTSTLGLRESCLLIVLLMLVVFISSPSFPSFPSSPSFPSDWSMGIILNCIWFLYLLLASIIFPLNCCKKHNNAYLLILKNRYYLACIYFFVFLDFQWEKCDWCINCLHEISYIISTVRLINPSFLLHFNIYCVCLCLYVLT